MKAVIEGRLNLDYDISRVKHQFDEIIDIILYAKDAKHLREIMGKVEADKDNSFFHFDFGFGEKHLWVKQKGFENRVVFVQL